MRPHPSIRDAALYDAPIAARTLARAFDADPSLNWALRRDEKRRQAMLEFFDVSFRVMTLPFGCVQMTEDGAGVALWTPPGKWQLGVWKQLGLFPTFVRVLGAARLPRMVRCMNVLQERHPRVPHYYLFAMGVDPEKQGQGVGSALLRSMLARCDEENMPAYLESTTDQSRKLYARWGFLVREEFRMAPDAPPLWLMWRAPANAERGHAEDSSR